MHSGLRRLKDVIIFSTKGNTPLADMLSGGDYDGDKPWICWDRRLVAPFQNNRSFAAFQQWKQDKYFEPCDPEKRFLYDLHPTYPSPHFYKQFFRRGFASAIQEELLGLCTTALSRYTYFEKPGELDKQQIHLAKLCSVLVDAPKQGIRPTKETVDSIYALLNSFKGKPAYKDLSNEEGSHPSGDADEWYILDRLILDVGQRKVAEKKQQFMDLQERQTKWPDAHLSKLWNDVNNECHATSNKSLRRLLTRLDEDLHNVSRAWERAMRTNRAGNFRAAAEPVYALFKSIRPAPDEEINADRRIKEWYDNGEHPCSEWRLLKASKLFVISCTSRLAWWMAMPELCYLKGRESTRERGGQAPRIVCDDMYLILKPVAPAPRDEDD